MGNIMYIIFSIGLLFVIFCYALQMLMDIKNDKKTSEANKAIYEIELIKREAMKGENNE